MLICVMHLWKDEELSITKVASFIIIKIYVCKEGSFIHAKLVFLENKKWCEEEFFCAYHIGVEDTY